MFAISFCLDPKPPQIRKVKIAQLRFVQIRNFSESSMSPFLASHGFRKDKNPDKNGSSNLGTWRYFA
jgi:hypothetical protein